MGPAGNIVVVVDDELTVLSTARAILSRAGHQVHAAASGQEAMAVLARLGAAVQVVVLDWTLPDVAGMVVLAAIDKTAPGARVIVSTGFGRDDVVLAGSAERVSFLEKPYTAVALLAAVAAALGNDAQGGSP